VVRAEHEILDCIRTDRDVTPAELARTLRMSEAGVNSLLAMMAAGGKIQIRTVGAVPDHVSAC